MSFEESLVIKNKLYAVNSKVNKALSIHNELEHNLNECILINGVILEEELFDSIKRNIVEIQAEVNYLINII